MVALISFLLIASSVLLWTEMVVRAAAALKVAPGQTLRGPDPESQVNLGRFVLVEQAAA